MHAINEFVRVERQRPRERERGKIDIRSVRVERQRQRERERGKIDIRSVRVERQR